METLKVPKKDGISSIANGNWERYDDTATINARVTFTTDYSHEHILLVIQDYECLLNMNLLFDL